MGLDDWLGWWVNGWMEGLQNMQNDDVRRDTLIGEVGLDEV